MPTTRFKGTDWMAAVFYPLAVILMEAFWVSPWLSWVGQWPLFRDNRPILNLISVAVILAVSLVLTRLVSRQKLPMWAVQVGIIGAGVLAMLLVLAVEYADGYTFLSGAWFAHIAGVLGSSLHNPGTIILALPAFVYLWWRGIVLGASTTYFKDIYRSFLLGLGMLILLLVSWQISASSGKIEPPGGGLGLNVVAFFFFGLLSIAICHLYAMRRNMPKEDAALTSVWRWLPVMLGVVGGVVLIGFGVASIFSSDMFNTIANGFDVVLNVVGKLLQYLITPFVYIIAGLVYALKWLLALLAGTPPDQQQQGGMPGQPEWGEVTTKDMPLWLGEMLKWLIVVAVIALVIFILAKTISRYRAKQAKNEIDETRESLFSWRGLRDDLKELFGMMGNRFRRKTEEAGTKFDPDAVGRMDIREIYRHLQWEGRRSGITRRRYETTAEYAHRLERAVPDSVESIKNVRESVGGITEMYEAVRYGEIAVPEPQVDKANGFWLSVKAMLRRLRGE